MKIMVKNKKKKIEIKPVEDPITELLDEQVLVVEEVVNQIVKVKVKIGTLGFEQGIFEKGEVFEVSAERAKQMDPNDIEIL